MIVKGTFHPKIELFQPRWGAAAVATPPLTPPPSPGPTRYADSATEGAAAALEVAKGSERFGNATETKNSSWNRKTKEKRVQIPNVG